ncbi:MAG: hypothetical protein H6550_08525 [Chitinophagales bacterium]|nr:hypothetical protein [Chitinophagales bacterium]
MTVIISFTAFSQVKKIEYSAPFDEPQKGLCKVLQISNGNTFFIVVNSEGISVTVYKQDRKQASKRMLSSNLWDPKNMKKTTVEGIYEINGEPVIFLNQLNDREPVLYRIQLNPDNGSIAHQTEIGRLPKYKMLAGYALAFGVDEEDFIVEKDPYSDAYAVAHYNSFAHETDKRIEVVHYNIVNGEHKEVNRVFYDAQGYKYTTFIGMCVNGDKSVHMAAYGYNTASKGGKDSRVIISRLSKGDTKFTHLNIEFTDDFKETVGEMIYNPNTNIIQLLTITLEKSKGFVTYYNSLLSYIDPESLQIIKTTSSAISELNAHVKTTIKDKKEFAGMSVDLVLNHDNTSSILFEEKLEIINSHAPPESHLGLIGIVQMDNTGKEEQVYSLLKNQFAIGPSMPILYMSARRKSIWRYDIQKMQIDSRSFYSYNYINTSTNNTYVIFNDSKENHKNFGKPIEKFNDLRTIKNVSESVAVFEKLSNGRAETNYLFGRPTNDDYFSFCKIESSHFRDETNTYASMMVKRVKKDKKAYISWVTFE